MNETLLLKIQEFTIFLEKNLALTNSIKRSAEDKKWTLMESYIENRERSINIICSAQEKIDILINAVKASGLDDDTKEIIKSWAAQTNEWLKQTEILDQRIIVSLEEEKDITTQQIIQTFKSKHAFSGYDLSNVAK